MIDIFMDNDISVHKLFETVRKGRFRIYMMWVVPTAPATLSVHKLFETVRKGRFRIYMMWVVPTAPATLSVWH